MNLSRLLHRTCYVAEEMEALMFDVAFETAQFRKHLVKLYRDTYLIPLPSSIAGFVGAIMGVRRSELLDFSCSKGILAGAALLSYEGLVSETATLVKMSDWREYVRTPKRSILLYRPEYTFAVASPDGEVMAELERRLRSLDFEFEVFGGNDYNFVAEVGNVRRAQYVMTQEGSGYCRLPDLEATLGDGELRIDEVNDGEVSKYAFAYGPVLRLKIDSPAVSDGDLTIFVYETWRFLR